LTAKQKSFSFMKTLSVSLRSVQPAENHSSRGYARIAQRFDEEELADWRAGRNAVYQLAALTIGVRLAVADG
jgi:hypothetical protein